MEHKISLGPLEIVPERPFTHPDHAIADLEVLRYMADQLCQVLVEPEIYSLEARSIIVRRPQPDNWKHRMVIVEPRGLQMATDMTVVGFFGKKRPEADPGPLWPMDRFLVEELSSYPGLLSYSSLELEDGNFGNLVLFTDSEAKLQWSNCKLHAEAVEMSPGYYTSVSIYNGCLPGGIGGSHTMFLTSVKYYDYESNPIWRAVRNFSLTG